MYGTDGRTLVFNVANDDGHPGDGAIVDPVTGKNGMYLNGFANIFVISKSTTHSVKKTVLALTNLTSR